MRKFKLLLGLIFIICQTSFSQNVTLEGYAFESDNRGYLRSVKIKVLDSKSKVIIAKTATDEDGKFVIEVPTNGGYKVFGSKDLFHDKELMVSTVGKAANEIVYVKMKMERKPGYIFDVTIAEPRKSKDAPTDAITGALIEVYNNTKEEEVLVLKDHPSYTFKANFEEGNHYTLMIRKEGYFTKRMEAYVNVKGCILCFDGVGEVKPGVADNLTAGHKMGTLLANVELRPIEINKAIEIENIYYDYNKWNIRKDAADELDKLVGVLRDNPALIVELGSHTDSRGRDSYNLSLSEKRAIAAVEYIIEQGIDVDRINAKGYGETILVNKCKNGVDCSERSHQKNRRTELKITGIMDNDPLANKSLAVILEEEKFEKMLLELGSQEQIKVKEGEELPDEIKKQIEKQETQKIKQETIKIEKVKPVTTPKEKNESSTSIPKKEKEVSVAVDTNVKKQKVKKRDKPAPIVKEEVVNDKIKEEVYIEPDQDPFASSDNNTKVLVDDFEEEEEFVEEYTEVEDFDSSKNRESKIVEDIEIKTNTIRRPLPLAYDYSGHKIQFFTSANELLLSHEIFAHHGNITIEQRKNGTFAYLLGDFTNGESAQTFLDNVIAKRYPSAKVIQYKNGYRLQQ